MVASLGIRKYFPPAVDRLLLTGPTSVVSMHCDQDRPRFVGGQVQYCERSMLALSNAAWNSSSAPPDVQSRPRDNSGAVPPSALSLFRCPLNRSDVTINFRKYM